MIPVMIRAASLATSILSASAASGAHDEGFSSILKTSINDSGKSASDDNAAAAKIARLKIDKYSAGPPGAADSNGKSADNPCQDPSEVLRQLLHQMVVAAQQLNNDSLPRDASTEASSQSGQTGSAAAISDLLKEMSQLTSSANTAAEAATTAQESGIQALLASSQDNSVDKIGLKLIDKISASSNDAFLRTLNGSLQDNSMSVMDAGYGEKAESGQQSFGQGGKDAIFLSKPGSADDVLSQFKSEISSGPAAEAPRDSNDLREAPNLYAQGVQGMTSSVHEQSRIQETVSADKLSSLDTIIAKAVDSGQKNLVIRIDPPDLGSMHIRLSLDNGILKAEVRVDSSAIKDSFNLALPQIKTSLENSGIKISDFHVDVREEQYRNGQQSNNHGQQQRQDRETGNGFSDFFA